MKIRAKNHVLKDLIEDLRKKGVEQPIWTSLAHGLNRPQRNKHEVNLYDIERNAQAKETIVVPGVVLGSGIVTKPVTVAALKFSGQAQNVIEKAGGKCLSIQEVMNSKPETLRILG